ncbi:MAG: NAD(+)/NADH kinase [Lachnospiraceae bacterium]|nr:NAD(+)/NADH kinase [Lachnospiraceae bacterium]
MKRFCIITNKSKDESFEVTKKIEALISQYGGSSVSFSDPLIGESELSATEIKQLGTKYGELLKDCECAIVLGGDGTILETSRAIGDIEIPMIGINLGTLGFLSCIEKSQVELAVKKLVEDNFTIENRMLLNVKYNCKGITETYVALNDVTVTRSGLSRVIRTDVYINGEAVSSYWGDGCLVATPTGSTGYNLSAGGPIVTPEARLMCITPICPHTFNSRTIVVSGEDRVRIVIGEQKKFQDTESFVTIDGQIAKPLNSGDWIEVEQAEKKAKFIRFSEQSYFNVLKAKLKG